VRRPCLRVSRITARLQLPRGVSSTVGPGLAAPKPSRPRPHVQPPRPHAGPLRPNPGRAIAARRKRSRISWFAAMMVTDVKLVQTAAYIRLRGYRTARRSSLSGYILRSTFPLQTSSNVLNAKLRRSAAHMHPSDITTTTYFDKETRGLPVSGRPRPVPVGRSKTMAREHRTVK
jgi:hypothetical protein